MIRFRNCVAFLGFALGIQTISLLTIGFGYHPYYDSSSVPFDKLSKLNHFSQKSEPANNNNNNKKGKLVPLVVGGSDGSGTRAVVEILRQQFGITMIVDDPGTMDFHARNSWNDQGWPPFGHAALLHNNDDNRHSRSGFLYNDDNVVDHLVPENVTKEFQKLRNQLDQRYEQYKGSTSHSSTSTKISYGFKAPITLMLLPWIQKFMYPDTGFKFLHIVRDGRDVALSGNQSPVLHFYRDFYGAKQADRAMYHTYRNELHVLAMQLWNDWNLQAHRWMLLQKANARPNNHFDFLVLRTEDLCLQQNPYVLQQLADFLGVSISTTDVCCGISPTRDMGRSGVTGQSHFSEEQLQKKKVKERELSQKLAALKHKTIEELSLEEKMEFILQQRRASLRNSSDTVRDKGAVGEIAHHRRLDEKNDSDNNLQQLLAHQLQELKLNAASTSSNDIEEVSSRYGKWSSLLENAPELSKHLHAQGAVGLKLFGYEPPQPKLWASSFESNNNTIDDYDELCRKMVCETHNTDAK